VVVSQAVKAAVGGPQPRFIAVESESREPAELFDGALSDEEREVRVLYSYWDLEQEALFVALAPSGDVSWFDVNGEHIRRLALLGSGSTLELRLDVDRIWWDQRFEGVVGGNGDPKGEKDGRGSLWVGLRLGGT